MINEKIKQMLDSRDEEAYDLAFEILKTQNNLSEIQTCLLISDYFYKKMNNDFRLRTIYGR